MTNPNVYVQVVTEHSEYGTSTKDYVLTLNAETLARFELILCWLRENGEDA